MATKFQLENTFRPYLSDRLENRFPISVEKIIAGLESVMVGLCIRSFLNRHDKTILDSLSEGSNRLFIIKDKICIYPANDVQDDLDLCLVLNGNELNVCDLHDNYPQIVAQLENSWPALLSNASRIKNAFESNDAAMLINRSSGRILAASAGFTSITGIHEDTIIGSEYSDANREFGVFFEGKQLVMANLNCDEVYLTLLTISSQSPKSIDPNNKQEFIQPVEKSHEIIDEFQAVGMHVNRFNALLETNLHIAISPETLDKLDAVVAEITNYRTALPQNISQSIDSSNIKASLRLLIQSVLMSHRSLAGESAGTEIAVYRDENNDLQIKFDTPTVIEPNPRTEMNDWWQVVGNLSKRIDVRIGELQFTGNSIINRIHLKNEGLKSDENK